MVINAVDLGIIVKSARYLPNLTNLKRLIKRSFSKLTKILAGSSHSCPEDSLSCLNRFSTCENGFSLSLHFLYSVLDVFQLFAKFPIFLHLLLDVGNRIHDCRVVAAPETFSDVVIGKVEKMP